MNNKLLSLLGMCRRAGKLTIGYDKTLELFKKNKVLVILVAADTAPRTEKELRFHTNSALPVVRLEETKEQLSHAIGTAAGVVGVPDEGFAKQVILLSQGGTIV